MLGNVAEIMTAKDGQRHALAPVAVTSLPQRVKAASSSGVASMLGNTSTNWRSYGGRDRDLPAITQNRMLRLAHYLVAVNPFAKRILGLLRDFTVGDGISFEVKHEDPELQDEIREALTEFWEDPINNLDERWDTWCFEFPRDGEQILPVAVNKITGDCQLGYIDPMRVDYVLMDKDNGLITDSVVLQPAFPDMVKRTFKVVRQLEDGLYGIPEGAEDVCFFWAMNRPSNASRGVSEIFCLADWLDLLDRTLFNEVERRELLKVFAWVFELEGATKETVEEFKKYYDENYGGKLNPSELQILGGKTKLHAVTPDLHGKDNVDFSKFMTNFAFNGAGFPPHFHGDPEDTNRSTGDSMAIPVNRMLATYGRRIRRMVKEMLTFVLHQKIRVGYFGSKSKDAAKAKIDVKTFEVGRKEAKEVSEALKSLTESLMVATGKGWITEDDAASTFVGQLNLLGGEIKPAHQEEGDLSSEEKQRQADLENYQKQTEDALAS